MAVTTHLMFWIHSIELGDGGAGRRHVVHNINARKCATACRQRVVLVGKDQSGAHTLRRVARLACAQVGIQ